ncbi:glycosyltransferase [Neobacillus cucumis]|uniref:TPR domain-containing glycosyltransferase n=1 Tax=Neobacillus cucumis TaxID=1740721 RepID=UPI0018E0640C|nr:TPR domain-containing glycosyltransferase [Neobacillus cucumis]MBI0577790.1 glycosyltransferase [Neobacillus cucumis]
MIGISLCMIVKNEEKMLPACLKSVKDLVDEIIIVDTGSEDNTKEIARQFTDLIYDFEWIGDFAAARNFAFSKGTKEYLMWLDADDILLPEDQYKFLELKKSMKPEVDVVIMNYNLGVDAEGAPKVKFKRERLIKKSRNYPWIEPVHEYVEFSYSHNILHSDIAITHRQRDNRITDRNLKIIESVLDNKGILNSRQLYYYGRELTSNKRYKEATVAFNEFLEKDNNQSSSFYLTAFQDLYHCYNELNDKDNAIKSLLRSFEYIPPRAEIVCKIAYFYKEQGKITNAISWFQIALNLTTPNEDLGYIAEDLWGFIPATELSTIYLTQGNLKEAVFYLKKAAEFKPSHPLLQKLLLYIKYKIGALPQGNALTV